MGSPLIHTIEDSLKIVLKITELFQTTEGGIDHGL
jgi:hypothetical protein